ncbi:MAG: LapA family protein [Actinomycetota bacterium]
MSDEILDDETSAKKRGGQARMLIVAIVAVGLGAFVIQNTDSTPVTWLVFEGSAPLWLVIIAAAMAGAVLSELGGYLMRRRKRRQS